MEKKQAITLAQRSTPAPFEPETLDQAERLAMMLSKSTLLPRALQGKPGDVLVVLITGRELGLSPMQAIRGIHVIDGRPCMAADLMAALVQRRRDVCEWFRLVHSDDNRAVYETLRVGHPAPVKMEWTMEQAKAAGVAGKDNWRKYPAAMLRARCAAALIRAVYPDLMHGVYDPEELLAEPRHSRISATMREPFAEPRPSPEPAVQAVEDAELVEDKAAQREQGEDGMPSPEEAQAIEIEESLRAAAESGDRAAFQAVTAEIQKAPKAVQDRLRGAYAQYRQVLMANGNSEPSPQPAAR